MHADNYSFQFVPSESPFLVIGAGIGGLSAAIHLAIRGKKVRILEKNAVIGGKMAQIHQAGYRWDTGPSVITMRDVFERLFQAAGKDLYEYVDMIAVDPITRYHFPDGAVIDIFRDLPRTLEQIRQIEPRDVDGYLRFLAYAAHIYRIVAPVFIFDLPPRLSSLRKVSPFDIFKIDGLRSMQKAIEGFVRSPHLRQLLGRFATYVGASPYLAPATLNVIAHVELNQGVWYPKGGIYQLAQALEELALELGVDIQTDQCVKTITVRDDRVTGVVLSDNTHIPTQAIVANLDVTTVYEKLLPAKPTIRRRALQLSSRDPSCSGFIQLLGVKGHHPSLSHHNIFFSSNYYAEFDQIFKDGLPPNQPTIYVALTCRSTPQDAPKGSENWFVLVNVPALNKKWDWKSRAKEYAAHIMDQLAQFGVDVRNQIEVEHIQTPADLEYFNTARAGALYGSSSNNRWAAFMRPNNRSKEVKGLYFAGGTTHPGGGVPMVALSGKIAAQMLIQDGF